MEETLTTILEAEEEQEITDQPMPDVPQNPNSHPPDDASDSHSESESDSDSEDESQQKVELQTLETELSSNPSNYDSHVQYIRLLRKMGEIEKLRQAREAMSLLFPLTPSMWQDWAKDEASLATTQYHPHPLAFAFCFIVFDQFFLHNSWFRFVATVLVGPRLLLQSKSFTNEACSIIWFVIYLNN